MQNASVLLPLTDLHTRPFLPSLAQYCQPSVYFFLLYLSAVLPSVSWLFLLLLLLAISAKKNK